MPKRVEENQFYERYRKIRRDWDGMNPLTKVLPNQKPYSRKSKYKQDYDEYDDDYDDYYENF